MIRTVIIALLVYIFTLVILLRMIAYCTRGDHEE